MPVPAAPESLVRDQLAATRTVLANERTFLAYVRTALSLIAAGAFFIKFVQTSGMALLGWTMMPIGIIVLLFGIYRFRATKQSIQHVNREGN